MTCPDLLGETTTERSSKIAERVEAARLIQHERFAQRPGLFANGQMGPRDLKAFCRVDDTALSLLRSAMARFSLSARSFHRILKIARTVADLEEREVVGSTHVAEAIQYRGLDRSALDSATQMA